MYKSPLVNGLGPLGSQSNTQNSFFTVDNYNQT